MASRSVALRSSWKCADPATLPAACSASAISRYVLTSRSSVVATRCVLRSVIGPLEAAQLPALALRLDRGRDHHLDLVHIAYGLSAAHAHARPQRPDEVLRAVCKTRRPEEDLLERA